MRLALLRPALHRLGTKAACGDLCFAFAFDRRTHIGLSFLDDFFEFVEGFLPAVRAQAGQCQVNPVGHCLRIVAGKPGALRQYLETTGRDGLRGSGANQPQPRQPTVIAVNRVQVVLEQRIAPLA